MEFGKYISTYKYGQRNEHILTVETTGSLEPRQIILAGIEELSKRLEEFKEILVNLK